MDNYAYFGSVWLKLDELHRIGEVVHGAQYYKSDKAQEMIDLMAETRRRMKQADKERTCICGHPVTDHYESGCFWKYNCDCSRNEETACESALSK